MKLSRTSGVLILALVAAVLFSGTSAGAGSAGAAISAPAIPVSCIGWVGAGSPSGVINCLADDGSVSFDNNKIVPTGYWLLVTDIVATPDSTSDTTGVTDITVRDTPSNFGTIFFRMRNTTTASSQYHFNSPLLVLKAGDYLGVDATASSTKPVYLFISGILTTNLNYIYLPLTLKGA